MRAFLRVGAALAIAVAAGCSHAADRSGVSEADHTEGEYAWSNNAFQWATTDYADVAEEISNGLAALSESHVLSQRLQYWSEKIDAIVRAEATRRLGAPFRAPHPVIKVARSPDELNAWISAVPGCLGAGMTAGHDAATSPRDVLLLSRERALRATHITAVHPRGWPAADDSPSAWNASGPKVTLGWNDADETLTVGGASVDAPSPHHVAIASTSPFVHATTPLIANLDEKSVVLVLAHELAHYYRAHASPLTEPHYGFWYAKDPATPARPVPASDAAALQSAYEEVDAAPKPLGGPGLTTKYHARLRGFALEIGAALDKRTEPACVDAHAATAGEWVHDFLWNPLPAPDSRTKYVDYEAKLASCALSIAVGAPANGDPIATLTKLQANVALRLPGVTAPQSASTLDAFLTQLDTNVRALDARIADLDARMRVQHIGLYTQEQEADEIALDLVTKLGISADEALDAWRSVMLALEASNIQRYGERSVRDEQRATGEPTAAQCNALSQAGFTQTAPDGTKVPVFVTMGALADPHHANCYRLFNLWRETKAHAYPTQGQVAPPGPPWSDLQREAKRLSEESSADEDGGLVMPGSDAGAAPSTGDPRSASSTRAKDEGADASGGCAVSPSTPRSNAWLSTLAALAFAALFRRKRARDNS